MKKHYAIIDNCSGYLWGDTLAETPVDACKALDADIGTPFPVEYEETPASQLASNESGYHVYEVPESFDFGDGDGQDQELIDRISDLKRAAVVRTTQIID